MPPYIPCKIGDRTMSGSSKCYAMLALVMYKFTSSAKFACDSAFAAKIADVCMYRFAGHHLMITLDQGVTPIATCRPWTTACSGNNQVISDR